MNTRTQETELLDVSVSVIDRARRIEVDAVQSAQDAMLNLRIDWETLQACLKNRKLDGFEPAIEAMMQLAGTTIAMAATLQAKVLNQRLRQMENKDETIDLATEAKQYKNKQAGKRTKRRVVIK